MKIVMTLMLVLVIMLFTGCNATPDPTPGSYDDITSLYKLPPELKDCKVFRLRSNETLYLWNVYCPGKTTVNDIYSDGKMTIPVSVVKDEATTYPLGTEAATVAPTLPDTMDVPLSTAPLEPLAKLGYKITKVTCTDKDCDVTLTRN